MTCRNFLMTKFPNNLGRDPVAKFPSQIRSKKNSGPFYDKNRFFWVEFVKKFGFGKCSKHFDDNIVPLVFKGWS